MNSRLLLAVAALLVAGSPALAQAPASPPSGAEAAQDSGVKPKRTRKPSGEAAARRAASPNQLAARERQRKCSAEWKEAKAGGKTPAGATWPKFWSQCNARLKGKTA